MGIKKSLTQVVSVFDDWNNSFLLRIAPYLAMFFFFPMVAIYLFVLASIPDQATKDLFMTVSVLIFIVVSMINAHE